MHKLTEKNLKFKIFRKRTKKKKIQINILVLKIDRRIDKFDNTLRTRELQNYRYFTFLCFCFKLSIIMIWFKMNYRQTQKKCRYINSSTTNALESSGKVGATQRFAMELEQRWSNKNEIHAMPYVKILFLFFSLSRKNRDRHEEHSKDKN